MKNKENRAKEPKCRLSDLRNMLCGVDRDIHDLWQNSKDILSGVQDIKRNLNPGARVKAENEYFRRMLEILMQFISDKYDKGTIILYDEHSPRTVNVVKDGKWVDISKAKSITFYWNAGEFPTLTVDE